MPCGTTRSYVYVHHHARSNTTRCQVEPTPGTYEHEPRYFEELYHMLIASHIASQEVTGEEYVHTPSSVLPASNRM